MARSKKKGDAVERVREVMPASFDDAVMKAAPVLRWSCELPPNPVLVVEAATEDEARVAYMAAMSVTQTDHAVTVAPVGR